VFITIVRRIFKALVFFFAAYAFVFMPLGDKTPLEHVLAIVRTPQAKKAGSELKTGAERLVQKLKEKARSVEDEDEAEEQAPPPRHADKLVPTVKRPLSGATPAGSAPAPSAPAAPSAAAAIGR
jgi:hypothetical protein